MDFSASTFWWVAAGIVVAAELASGTFYLLMIALGLAAAAVATLLGVGLTAQVLVAAAVGGGATAFWHWRRARHPRSLAASFNRDVNLDIGERIDVVAWADDNTARVAYRGSTWTARLAPDATIRAPGPHVVAAVEGNWLVLTPAARP